MEPIELTKEWRRKLGFVNDILTMGTVELIFHSSYNKYLLSVEHGYTVLPHIKTVEDIQRLYLGLTGKPLILTE